MNEEQSTRRKPGPRPKKQRNVTTTISMPADLKAALDAAAEEDDLSMAEVIRLALTDWLAKRRLHTGGES